ncbi:MAG: hypothetical protein WCC17_19180 [Candidatus Nitrosopolaris sp.]|jgi:hypothetical protein
MKLIKPNVLLDGFDEKKNPIIGFDDDEIKYYPKTRLKTSSSVDAILRK